MIAIYHETGFHYYFGYEPRLTNHTYTVHPINAYPRHSIYGVKTAVTIISKTVILTRSVLERLPAKFVQLLPRDKILRDAFTPAETFTPS